MKTLLLLKCGEKVSADDGEMKLSRRLRLSASFVMSTDFNAETRKLLERELFKE